VRERRLDGGGAYEVVGLLTREMLFALTARMGNGAPIRGEGGRAIWDIDWPLGLARMGNMTNGPI
jgi:hypothetical protein